MVFRRFGLQLLIRLAALFGCLTGLAFLITGTELVAAPLLVAVVALSLAWEMASYVRRTNAELTRFLQAIRHADFSQTFTMSDLGTGFGELGDTLGALMERFRASRATQEKELRYLRAVVEHVPVPLLSLAPQGSLTLLNNAARRFFAPHAVSRKEDLERFGPEFAAAVTQMRAGERRLVRLGLAGDEGPQRVALSLTEVVVGGEPARLIAVQNISSELEATELEAWQQLVRVLTHEIMNSITPVSSLAETAATLLKDSDDPETLADVKDAVETVARRSNALMNFVQSYRQLARLPRPKPQRMALADLFHRLETLTRGEWRDRPIQLDAQVTPPGLTVEADPEQVEQVLINLLRNAGEALEGRPDGRIWLTARLNRRGRVAIEVADNGPGVPAEIAEQIFVPFFTTKRTGSGVGLALTRQVMIGHKGSVALGSREGGGAAFTLTF